MKISEIIELLNREFPCEDAYEWDNVGLLVGDKNRDADKVLVCLDVTEAVLNEAKEMGAQLIVAHHPMIFSPVSKITSDTKEGRMLLFAIENKIAVYAAHTNCDKGKNGINTRLCDIFELCETEPLEADGLGRLGSLKAEMTGRQFAEFVSRKLKCNVRLCGEENRVIRKVAVCSGAGCDCAQSAIESGADVLVTGDTKYHQMLELKDKINVVDAGHYPTEIVVTDIFKEILCPQDIEVVEAKSQDVYRFI